MEVRRGRAWVRWLGVPWSDLLLAVVLVGAAAAPVFLVGAVDVWRAAAQDDVAARAVELASPDRNGVDVSHEVAFVPDGVARADSAMRSELARVPRLDRPDLSLYTLPGLVTVGEPVRQVGPAGRLFARDGAIEALDLVAVAPDTTGGIYVSSWFAERHELALGDFVGFEAGAIVDEQWNDIVQGGGTANVFPIVGLYERLWSEDGDVLRSDYWDRVPGEVVPTYIPSFNAPNTELMVASEETLLASGLTGVARWRAASTGLPETYDELVALRSDMRRFEFSLVDDGELGEAVVDIATVVGARPRLTTEIFDTVGEVAAAAGRLDAPLGSVRAVGAVIGLIGMVAVGVFFVERRRTEFRLLAGEGEAWWRIAARVGLQLVLPVAVGAVVGVVVAAFGLRWFGPAQRADFGVMPWWSLAAVGAAGLATAALSAGVVSARTLAHQRTRPSRTIALLAFVALSGALVVSWIQVGRTATVTQSDVDLSVVLLPILALLVAVVAGTTLCSLALRASARRADRLPTPVFLAVRRLAIGNGGLRPVATGIGLGVGLLVFALALTSTLDRTVDVKLASLVGGESAITLLDAVPPDVELPPGTTLLRSFDSVLRPGGGRVRVLAIDPDTWPDAVTWPTSFGRDPASIVRLLDRSLEGAVPAVAVQGESAPTRGAFGLTQSFAYETVATAASLPGAGRNASTLLIRATALDELAMAEQGFASPEAAAAGGFESPTRRFRRQLVSQASLPELIAAVEDAGLRFRDPVSVAEERTAPGLLAARTAFGFLGVLGIVSAVGAFVALGLFLDSRRRVRALTGVMTTSMGLSRGRSAWVTALEVGTILVLALASAFAVVPFVVEQLSPRFDPDPDVPPPVDALVDWGALGIVAAVAVVVVGGLVWLGDWRAAGRPAGEVLRRAG